MEAFFNPFLTFQTRIDPQFEGVFSLAFDESLPYTHKSQYLTRATLTGTLDSGLLGNDQDNILQGNQGSNALDGGEGEDTATFRGPSSEYEIARGDQTLVVTDRVADRDGQDRLVGVEWLQFEDGRQSATEVSP
jgi:Ca2+-binding RTX toxin-like protein